MKRTKRLLDNSRSMYRILRLLKYTVLLLTLATLQVSAKTYSQERITLKLQAAELKSALKQIEKRSIFRFLYNDQVVSSHQKINIDANNALVTDVLNEMFGQAGLSYKVLVNNLVVITQKNLDIKDVTVTGKVTAAGQAVPGVTVRVKGSNAATSTDANGVYSIGVPEGATLVFSSIGYVTQEVAVGGRTEINVTLEISAKDINEVVVIGYGTAAKRDLTGSIVKVSGKEISDKPNTNPVASLQSKVAGLSIVNNGTPGKAPDIRIRGTISIGSVSPLYVVDGVFNDNIDYINPNDIESIEILKDPSSLAIFGVRGAAGVIAITTKKAKNGQVIINLNAATGFKKLVDKIELADAAQFKTLYDEERGNLGITVPFDYTPWTANTDWIDAVTRTAKFTNTSLSVSGSTDKNKFNMGVGYIRDEGIVKHERLEKITLSFSDEFKLSKAIKVGFNFNGARTNNPYDLTFILNEARKVAPMVPSGTKSVYTKNPYGLDSGFYNLYYALPAIQNSGVDNPLIRLENEWQTHLSTEFRTVGSVFAEVNFLRYFNFKTTFYGDLSNVNSKGYTPLYQAYDAASDAPFNYTTATAFNEYDGTYRKWQQDYILNFKKTFDAHSLSLVGGWTTYYFSNFNRNASVSQSITGSPIPNDRRFWFIDNGFGDAATKKSSSDQRERSTVSALFRAIYNYKGKYFLNGSFRRDGSSQISPANRFQNFWAVGGAWEISKENFMGNQKLFDFLKFKASIGTLGNQNTYGYDYPYYPGLVGGQAAVFGPNVYLANSQAYLPNPNLKWETVNAKEIGLELAAFGNRLHFEVAYFDKTTNDLMTYIPGLNGASNGLDNIGKIKNSGFEFSGNWNQKVGRDLQVTISGNLTTYKNEVLELAREGFVIADGLSVTSVGQPIGYFSGYVVDGIYQSYADKLKSPVNTQFTYGPGDFKYKDLNGDGIITPADKTNIGNPTPDFTYGGSINFSYKGIDLGIDVGGIYGNEIYRNWGSTESPFQRVNYPAFKINRWHGEGTSNWDPILGQDHRINYEISTYAVEDGSYFRLRNIQLGYNLPQTLVSKAKIKNLRLYANMQNVKTWKHNSGFTTEYGGSATAFGIDNAGGAIPSVTTFGLNVTF